MKKTYFTLAGFALVVGLAACSNNSDSTTSTDSSGTSTTPSDSNMSTSNTSTTNDTSNMSSATAPTVSKTPLGKDDSTFAMKAAVGGMMEVESGNVAQQNAQSDRIKSYGAMMVKDHGAANQELASLATTKGLTIPMALPADKQKHVNDMKGMKGKSFDSHYISMMLNDHKKTIADFEKESSNGKDPDLKAWASKTLPTLKAHLDSIQAISKAKPM